MQMPAGYTRSTCARMFCKVCPCASCLILMQSEGKSDADAASQRPPTQSGDAAAPDAGAAGSDTTQDVIQSAVGCHRLQPTAASDALLVYTSASVRRFLEVLLLTFCNLRWAQTAALDAARKALENTRSRAPSRPDPSRTFSYTDTKCADVPVAPGCTTRRMSSRG